MVLRTVYLGLEVFPAMGLPVDLLLTTGEERGESSAAVFRTRKQYKWIFSFDRMGDDVVCYQYECSALTNLLRGAGFRIGVGTYSCISELEHLGCCGINFGCGMFDYHTDGAYCDLPMLGAQLERFAQFYGLNAARNLLNLALGREPTRHSGPGTGPDTGCETATIAA